MMPEKVDEEVLDSNLLGVLSPAVTEMQVDVT
jgi:hypothetical protein